MKHILKKAENEPSSLKKHKKKSFSNYQNYDEKDDTRLALLREQGFLCCYCTARVAHASSQTMVIEHFRPFSKHEKLRLEWSNLLASCSGGEGGPTHLFHCDQSKKETEIEFNPTVLPHVEQVKYRSDGSIFSENEAFDKTLNDILRLNLQHLKSSREGVARAIEQKIKKDFSGEKAVKKSWLNERIKKMEGQNANGQFQAFAQVALFFLKKRLSKAV